MVEGRGFRDIAQELLDIGSQYGGTILAEDVLPCTRSVSIHVVEEYKKVKALVVEELQQVRYAPQFCNVRVKFLSLIINSLLNLVQRPCCHH